MPTLTELCNAKLPQNRIIDGRSFVNQIKAEDGEERNWAYVEWEGESWIRTQDWKLYSNGNLFNMKTDTGEKRPIKAADDSDTSAKIRKYLMDEERKLKRKK